MVEAKKQTSKLENHELPSCCFCFYRLITDEEKDYCCKYQQTIPEGFDYGTVCPSLTPLK